MKELRRSLVLTLWMLTALLSSSQDLKPVKVIGDTLCWTFEQSKEIAKYMVSDSVRGKAIAVCDSAINSLERAVSKGDTTIKELLLTKTDLEAFIDSQNNELENNKQIIALKDKEIKRQKKVKWVAVAGNALLLTLLIIK